MSLNPSVHGIVVTYNRPHELLLSCAAALAQTHALTTLVVVDNSDCPAGAEWLQQELEPHPTDLVLVHPGENVGPAGGLALGMRAIEDRIVDEDFVLVLDDDDPLTSATVVESLLGIAMDLAQSDADFGGIGLKGARFDRRHLRTLAVDEADGSIQRVDHLHGGYAPVYVAGALRAAGGFRPELFWGFEELETGLRVTDSGRNLYMAVGLWKSMAPTGKDSRVQPQPALLLKDCSPRRYYTLRNLLWIGRQHAPTRSVLGVALVRGVLKPLCSLPVRPRIASKQLRLNLVAVGHAMIGRLGRTYTW